MRRTHMGLPLVAAVLVLSAPLGAVDAQATAGEGVDEGLCFGREPTMVGDAGQRVIHGTDGDDVIIGGPAKRIYGHRGHDRICNEIGPVRNDDSLHFPSIHGGRGSDLIEGTFRADEKRLYFLHGGRGDDVLVGGSAGRGDRGDDDLTAGTYGSALVGGAGDDLMQAGPGQDSFVVGPDGADTVIASPECPADFCDFLELREASVVDLDAGYMVAKGNHKTLINVHRVHIYTPDHPVTLLGSNSADVLSAYCRVSSERHVCYSAPVVLDGRGGDDFLSGGWGDDRMYGGEGRDELKGDRGADLLAGGDGDDRHHGGRGMRDTCTDDVGVNEFIRCEA